MAESFRGLAKLWSRVGLTHSHVSVLDASRRLAKGRKRKIHSEESDRTSSDSLRCISLADGGGNNRNPARGRLRSKKWLL